MTFILFAQKSLFGKRSAPTTLRIFSLGIITDRECQFFCVAFNVPVSRKKRLVKIIKLPKNTHSKCPRRLLLVFPVVVEEEKEDEKIRY